MRPFTLKRVWESDLSPHELALSLDLYTSPPTRFNKVSSAYGEFVGEVSDSGFQMFYNQFMNAHTRGLPPDFRGRFDQQGEKTKITVEVGHTGFWIMCILAVAIAVFTMVPAIPMLANGDPSAFIAAVTMLGMISLINFLFFQLPARRGLKTLYRIFSEADGNLQDLTD